MQIYDLHSHSTASDGGLTPALLVQQAVAAGVDVLALTDHDTVDGLRQAQTAARAENIRLINGIEISVRWQKRTLHIVGLGINPDSDPLLKAIQQLQATRRERAERIAHKLEKQGLVDALQKAEALTQGAQITRTHFARLLVESGLCSDMKQAFKRYLAAGKSAYVSAQWIELEAAIEAIHAAGGLAVLAHPMHYGLSGAWRERMHIAFKEAGGDAVEVCCGSSNPAQVQLSSRAALAHDLLASAGSDFHHPEQRWVRLGKLPPMPPALTPVWQHPAFQALLA